MDEKRSVLISSTLCLPKRTNPSLVMEILLLMLRTVEERKRYGEKQHTLTARRRKKTSKTEREHNEIRTENEIRMKKWNYIFYCSSLAYVHSRCTRYKDALRQQWFYYSVKTMSQPDRRRILELMILRLLSWLSSRQADHGFRSTFRIALLSNATTSTTSINHYFV